MPKLASILGLSVAVSIITGFFPSFAQTGIPKTFDAAQAFCERQTFTLDSMEEVGPWLEYFSGLRNGRSPPPNENCQSSAVGAIIKISQSKDLATAEASRLGFLRFYVARAMEPALGDRRNDVDGSFRYRNDMVLASFVWFLCPGHGETRMSCVKDIIQEFPAPFVQTSPVLCDFARFDGAKVEWPPQREVAPMVCASGGRSGSGDPKGWLNKAQISFGD